MKYKLILESAILQMEIYLQDFIIPRFFNRGKGARAI